MEDRTQCKAELSRRAPNRFHPSGRSRSRRIKLNLGAALVLLATSPALFTQNAPPPAAQPPAHVSAQPAPAQRTPASHRHTATRHPAKSHTKPSPAVPVAPPTPPRPNWPAEQPPNPARVTWDSKGLAIQASNSSLRQILNEISTDTGVKLQGLNRDERVFGNYGPGPAREVLSQLLDGSGFNVLMIGGHGNEPPRQIILTPGTTGPAQPAGVQNRPPAVDDDEAEPSEEPPMGEPEPPAPRTPQEIQQEMLMRQQQMQRQQQQMQQQQQPPPQQQQQQQQPPRRY